MADVSIDATVSTSTARANRCVVFPTQLIGYVFYIDSDGTFGYSKTIDGGGTWGTKVTVDTTGATTVIAFDVWFDQWTPGDAGTLIHTWWFDSAADIIRYKTLNITGDALGTGRVVLAASSAVAGRGAFISGTKTRSGYLYCAYDIDAGAERGLHRSTDGGPTWSANLATTFIEATLDTCKLFPASGTGDNNDCWALYYDASATALTLKLWDSSAASEVESATIQTHTDGPTDLTGQYGYDGAIRNSDGHLIMAAVSLRDNASSVHQVFDITSTSTITTKTNITTNIDDHYYPQVFVNQGTETIFVAYNGKRDGSEVLDTTTKVYYTYSTDGGATWNAGDAAYMEGAAGVVQQVWTPITGQRFYCIWRVAGTLLGNKVNSLIQLAVTAPTITAGSVANAPTPVSPGAVTVVGGTIAVASAANAPLTVRLNVTGATVASTFVAFALTVALPQAITTGTIGGGSSSLATGLVSYWSLDEASGTRLDSHGTNHLTDHNTVGSATGKVGNAADFEVDNSEYLSHANNADLTTGDISFTFSVWIKWEGGGSYSIVLSRRSSTSPADTEYILYINASGGGLVWSVGSGGVAPLSLSTGVWYHLIVWYDSVANFLAVDVNGANVGSTTYSTYDVTNLSSPFEIGAASVQGLYFDGLIDEVGFWKRVLTSGERTQLYNGGAGLSYAAISGGGGATLFAPTVAQPAAQAVTTGTIGGAASTLLTDLISYWELEESSGIRNDAHGANHLSEPPFKTVGSGSGKIGNAASFVITDVDHKHYLEIVSNADVQVGNHDFAFCAWVKLGNKASTSGAATILAKGSDSVAEYFLRWVTAWDLFDFQVTDTGGYGDITGVYATSLASTSEGVWYFVVGWHDAAGDTINIQVNNGAVDSSAHTGGGYTGAGKFLIGGGYPFPDSASQLWDGQIDQVGFWKRALTTDERTQLYNGSAGLAYAALSGGGGGGAALFEPTVAISVAVDQTVVLPIIAGSFTYGSSLGGVLVGGYTALAVIGSSQTFAPTVEIAVTVSAATITAASVARAPTNVTVGPVTITGATVAAASVASAPITLAPGPVAVIAATIATASQASAPPTLAVGAVTVLAATRTTTQQVFAPTLAALATGATIVSGSSASPPAAALTVTTATRATTAQTFAPTLAATVLGSSVAATSQATAPTTVAAGAVTVIGATIASTAFVQAPATVATGPVTIVGATVASTAQVSAPPTVAVGAATVIGGSVAPALQMFAPTVLPVGGLGGPTAPSTLQLFGVTVAAGAVTVVGATIPQTATLTAPSVAVFVSGATVAATSQLFAPALVPTGALGGPHAPPTVQMFGASVTTGAVTIVGATSASALQLFAPALAAGAYAVGGASADSTLQVFAPSLAAGAVTVAGATVAPTRLVFAPALSAIAEGATIVSGAALFAPTLVGTVLLAPIASGTQTFAMVIVPGVVTVTTPTIGTTAVLYSLAVGRPGGGVYSDTPAARTWAVGCHDRVFSVVSEPRIWVLAPEDRRVSVTAESRMWVLASAADVDRTWSVTADLVTLAYAGEGCCS